MLYSQKLRLFAATFPLIAIIGVNTVASEPLRLISTVVIDAGHGGRNLGAKNSNLAVEKNFTRKLANALKKEIISNNGDAVKVVFTRPGKNDFTQEERAHIANSNKGDIYISFHAASGYGKDSHDLGIFVFEDKPGTSWETVGLQYAQENLQFARTLKIHLDAIYPYKEFVIRRGNFIPLQGIGMTAVLVEAVGLNDPRDEMEISREDFYIKFSKAVYGALLEYGINR
ncbi:MAG: N-acetylmuramoyl-L-alanine amidase [Nitrospinota bacterium]|nr:N-acetylmuramoyl-L-alanine amidase [Nitrospinota bacterium]